MSDLRNIENQEDKKQILSAILDIAINEDSPLHAQLLGDSEFYADLLANYKDANKLIVLEIFIYLLMSDKHGCATMLNEPDLQTSILELFSQDLPSMLHPKD